MHDRLAISVLLAFIILLLTSSPTFLDGGGLDAYGGPVRVSISDSQPEMPRPLEEYNAELSPSGTQEIHDGRHCLKGCPAGAPSSNDLIVRDIYILSNDGRTKFATWVAYRVTNDTIGPSRPRTWRADPLLDEDKTLEPPDYREAHARFHVDRGYQVPLASFSGTPQWEYTNLLSNITPQRSDLNQGPWARLEEAVRNLAGRNDIEAVYVMTGPLYEHRMFFLPHADESHRIPSGYWKVVAIEQEGSVRAQAFIFGQFTPRQAYYCDHRVSVEEVENRTTLNLFHALTVEEQEQLEKGPGTLAEELGCVP